VRRQPGITPVAEDVNDYDAQGRDGAALVIDRDEHDRRF